MIIISSLAIAIFVFVWAIRLECDYKIKEETSFNGYELYGLKLKLEQACSLSCKDGLVDASFFQDVISSNFFGTALTFDNIPYIYTRDDNDFKILVYKKYCRTYKEYYHWKQKHKLWRYDVYYKDLKLRKYYNINNMAAHLEDLYKKRTRYYKKAQIKNIALLEHIHESRGI